MVQTVFQEMNTKQVLAGQVVILDHTNQKEIKQKNAYLGEILKI